jgi:hypothetical protein
MHLAHISTKNILTFVYIYDRMYNTQQYILLFVYIFLNKHNFMSVTFILM